MISSLPKIKIFCKYRPKRTQNTFGFGKIGFSFASYFKQNGWKLIWSVLKSASSRSSSNTSQLKTPTNFTKPKVKPKEFVFKILFLQIIPQIVLHWVIIESERFFHLFCIMKSVRWKNKPDLFIFNISTGVFQFCTKNVCKYCRS